MVPRNQTKPQKQRVLTQENSLFPFDPDCLKENGDFYSCLVRDWIQFFHWKMSKNNRKEIPVDLLQKFTMQFHLNDSLYNERQFVYFWLRLAKSVKDKEAVLAFMFLKKIGENSVCFYQILSKHYEDKGEFILARDSIDLGIKRQSMLDDTNKLKELKSHFAKRMAERLQRDFYMKGKKVYDEDSLSIEDFLELRGKSVPFRLEKIIEDPFEFLFPKQKGFWVDDVPKEEKKQIEKSKSHRRLSDLVNKTKNSSLNFKVYIDKHLREFDILLAYEYEFLCAKYSQSKPVAQKQRKTGAPLFWYTALHLVELEKEGKISKDQIKTLFIEENQEKSSPKEKENQDAPVRKENIWETPPNAKKTKEGQRIKESSFTPSKEANFKENCSFQSSPMSNGIKNEENLRQRSGIETKEALNEPSFNEKGQEEKVNGESQSQESEKKSEEEKLSSDQETDKEKIQKEFFWGAEQSQKPETISKNQQLLHFDHSGSPSFNQKDASPEQKEDSNISFAHLSQMQVQITSFFLESPEKSKEPSDYQPNNPSQPVDRPQNPSEPLIMPERSSSPLDNDNAFSTPISKEKSESFSITEDLFGQMRNISPLIRRFSPAAPLSDEHPRTQRMSLQSQKSCFSFVGSCKFPGSSRKKIKTVDMRQLPRSPSSAFLFTPINQIKFHKETDQMTNGLLGWNEKGQFHHFLEDESYEETSEFPFSFQKDFDFHSEQNWIEKGNIEAQNENQNNNENGSPPVFGFFENESNKENGRSPMMPERRGLDADDLRLSQRRVPFSPLPKDVFGIGFRKERGKTPGSEF